MDSYTPNDEKKKEENFCSGDVEYRVIKSEELREKIKSGEKFTLVDCRPEDEYEAGHIPGALNVSIDSYTFGEDTVLKDSLKKIKETVGKEIHFVLIDSESGEEYMPKTKMLELVNYLPEERHEEVIFYCRRLDCTRSPMAARWAVSLGYRNVLRYEGGWQEWSNRAYTSEKKENQPGLGNPKVHELTEDIFAVTSLYHSGEPLAGVNAGIIFTKRSIVFIDSGMTIASAEFLWQIAKKRMKGDEKLYLILTHHHSDHVFGMRVMRDRKAKVIAHRIVKEELKDDNGRYKSFIIQIRGWNRIKGDEILGDVILSIPDRIIDKDTILKIDNEEIHLLVTPGHTPDSISVYHPISKTLFAGDTIYEGMRLNTRFGGPEEWKLWISQLECFKQLEINTIVPGHGKLCSKKEIDRNIAYLQKEIARKSSFNSRK